MMYSGKSIDAEKELSKILSDEVLKGMGRHLMKYVCDKCWYIDLAHDTTKEFICPVCKRNSKINNLLENAE